jgi:hypothetical protein
MGDFLPSYFVWKQTTTVSEEEDDDDSDSHFGELVET